MRTIVICAALVALACGQSCPNAVGLPQRYMDCIDDKLNGRPPAARRLDDEFRRDTLALSSECFSSRQNDALCYGQAVAKSDELNRMGVVNWTLAQMQDCRTCRTVAKVVFKMFKSAKPATLSCIRDVVDSQVEQALAPCIRQKANWYRSIDLPNFDRLMAETAEGRVQMLETIVHVMLTKADFRKCMQARAGKQAGNPAYQRAKATFECLKAKEVDGRKIWPSHCGIMKDCRSGLSSSCLSDFKTIEAATCNCITKQARETKTVLRSAGVKLYQYTVRNSGRENDQNRRDTCERTVKETLTTLEAQAGLDLSKAFTSIKQCVGDHETAVSQGQLDSFTIDTLIKHGCRIYARSNDPSKVMDAINLGTQVFDALIERVTRFCPEAHCGINEQY